MNTRSVSFPEAACAYEVYDPATLIPENEATVVRLLELGWTAEDFAGKTVLDIGCNTGALSIHAHKLGAKSIHSTDVQEPLVEFFTAVAANHKLPVEVERKGFWQLKPEKDSADIVLFMEVLHWIVDQGGRVDDAIAHLASITNETLYLETPWDVKEPSIARKAIVTEDQYNIELIMRELAKHFRSVSFVRFMTYFGNMANSKRVLLKATGRRPSSLPMKVFAEANLVDFSLARGPNRIELVTTRGGPKVLKTLPAGAPISKLSAETFNALFADLHARNASTLVLPEKIGEDYRSIGPEGRTYMLFPYVGKLEHVYPTWRLPSPLTSMFDAAVRLRAELAVIPKTIIDEVRAVTPTLPKASVDILAATKGAFETGSEDYRFLEQACAGADAYDRNREDAIAHSDLQQGNAILDAKGLCRFIDLDLLRTGTAYSDLLTCVIYNGFSYDQLAEGVDKLAKTNLRAIDRFDVDFSVVQTLGWLKTISGMDKLSDRAISFYKTGIRAVRELAERL